MYYYKKEDIAVRDSVEEDIIPVADNMRKDDINEIWAAAHLSAREALQRSFDHSVKCFTVLKGDRPIMMFGAAPVHFLGETGAVWMLATDDFCDIHKKFIRESRKFIQLMLGYYPHLYNMIDVRNQASRRWLAWCGAKIGEVMPFGIDKLPFQYFEFRRA